MHPDISMSLGLIRQCMRSVRDRDRRDLQACIQPGPRRSSSLKTRPLPVRLSPNRRYERSIPSPRSIIPSADAFRGLFGPLRLRDDHLLYPSRLFLLFFLLPSR